MKKNNEQQNRAARIRRIAPTTEPISSFVQLADLIRHVNSTPCEYWVLNKKLYFGAYGGTYMPNDAHFFLCHEGTPHQPLQGFVEIADAQLRDILKKMFAADHEFYFCFGREKQYTFDDAALWGELEEDENK